MRKDENYNFRIGEESINYQGVPMRITAYRECNDIDVLFLNGKNEVRKTRYCHFLSGKVRCLTILIGCKYINKKGDTIEVIDIIDGSHSKIIFLSTGAIKIVNNKFLHAFTKQGKVKAANKRKRIAEKKQFNPSSEKTMIMAKQKKQKPTKAEIEGVKIEGYDYYVNKNGDIFNARGRKLKPILMPTGYHSVCLSNNNVRKSFSVHRIVAIAYLENPQNKPQVNHKNGIKTDNRLENLEWATRSENQKHKFDVLGYSLAGDKNTQSKLTWKQVEEIRSATNIQQKELATRYNVSVTTISEILSNKIWNHK